MITTKQIQFILVGSRRNDDALAAKAHEKILRHYSDRGENTENESAVEPPARLSPPLAAEAAAAPTIFESS